MNSKYFTRDEFACQCGCGFSTVDAELLEVLEDVREFFNEPVTITSGCRCDTHNRNVGGAEDSKHKYGIASDIQVRNHDAEDVYTYLANKYEGKYGIGLYDSWVHIDVRQDNGARWNKAQFNK